MPKANPPKTHRLEFSALLLLAATPCQFRLQSQPTHMPDGTRRIEAGLAINDHNGPLAFKVSPWFHTDISKVTIFYRRKDPEECAKVGRLKQILQQFHILYQDRYMGDKK